MTHTCHGTVSDATARARAEEEARFGAARFRALFAASAAGMVEVAPDGHILSANDAFCRMIGYAPAELAALTAGELLFPEDRDLILSQYAEVASGRTAAYEGARRYRRKDGSALWARVSAVAQGDAMPARVSAVVVDLSDQRRLEEQLWEAQKVETAGLLASCLAHDFNNLLTTISGCAQLLAAELPPAGQTHVLAQEMTAACRRASELTSQLRAFGRPAVVAPRALDVNEVVRRATRLLAPALGEDVDLITDLAGSLPPVEADPAQLEQVILNLAVNANDAMPGGGLLTVATRAVRFREGYEPAELPAGDYVRLTVSDTGTGMTDEVKARAFDPFFTTKEAGKGTGLGLAIVRGVVERGGGRVEITSEPGTGTTIDVLLRTTAARVCRGR